MVSFDSLRAFIDAIDADGELVRVRHPVSVDREIAEIADRCMKSAGGGPALLFEKVEGSNIPVLINMYGTEQRMAWALGVEKLDDLVDRVKEALGERVAGVFSGGKTGSPLTSVLEGVAAARDVDADGIVG